MQYTAQQYIKTVKEIKPLQEYDNIIEALKKYEQDTAKQQQLPESSKIDIAYLHEATKKLWDKINEITKQPGTQIDPLYKETALLLIISNKINNKINKETQDKEKLYEQMYNEDENQSINEAITSFKHYPYFKFDKETELWHPICSQCKKNDGITITMKFGKKLSTSETWFCDKNEIVHKPMALNEILGTLGIHIDAFNYRLK